MTSDEKRQLQKLAAKYERHGFSFVDILQMLSVNADLGFNGAYNITRLWLGQQCGEEEVFSLEELADINKSDTDTIRQWAVDHGIPIMKIQFPTIRKEGDVNG